MNFIINMVELYLDGNTLPIGYSIENIEKTPVSSVETLGKLTLRDNLLKISYLVEFIELIPLHGSGVDDINYVKSVSVINSTT